MSESFIRIKSKKPLIGSEVDEVLNCINKLLMICDKCNLNDCNQFCPLDLIAIEKMKARGIEIRDLTKIPKSKME